MKPTSSSVMAVTPFVFLLACSGRPPEATTSPDTGGPPSGGASGSAARSGATAGTDGGGAEAEASAEDSLFVPAGLSNTNVDGEDVGLTLAAFTLVQRPSGPELYAAVRNDGSAPACEAGMTTYFFDEAGQPVTSAACVLQSGRLYRLEDGTVLSCIGPGETAMAASTDLPDAVDVDKLGYLRHLFPAFTLDGVAPMGGLAVSGVQTVTTSGGTAYTGTVTNGLDRPVHAAKVTIFPVNRVGRPLGVARSSAPGEVPPGGTWTFETSAVDEPGFGYAVYPAGSITD